MRFLASFLLTLGLTTAATAQDFFPLGDEDVWTFGYVLTPPGSDPDTTRFDPVQISERVTIRDTAYAVVALPFLPSDTVRTDAEGRVWARVHGRDGLLLDVTRPDGETYAYALPSDPGLAYTVTVSRHGAVRTAGGTFENVISFWFDDPDVFDEEFGFELAPGVGIVTATGPVGSYVELLDARVGGERVTPLEGGPLSVAVARAAPNPFTSAVTIELPPGPWTRAEVTDLLGRRVATLAVHGARPLRWDAAGHPAGVYVVRVAGEGQSAAVRVTLAR